MEKEEAYSLLKRINNQFQFLGGGGELSSSVLDSIQKALLICEENFQKRKDKRFARNGSIILDTAHSVQYMLFLYYLSHTLYLDGDERNAAKIYYLNKIMHANDWFYPIDLPIHFGAEHPLGSILGRAKYGDYFFVYQGTTVGGNNSLYPVLGHHILMYSDSKILGNSHIGNYVVFSANSYVIDEDVPDNCIVFGQSPNIVYKKKSKEEMKKYFERIWEEN